eukprot:366093-Chlamydomonas_euryale.AAC.3
MAEKWHLLGIAVGIPPHTAEAKMIGICTDDKGITPRPLATLGSAWKGVIATSLHLLPGTTT